MTSEIKPEDVKLPEPFVVRHNAGEEGPIIKGNGFDGQGAVVMHLGRERHATVFAQAVFAQAGLAGALPFGGKPTLLALHHQAVSP